MEKIQQLEKVLYRVKEEVNAGKMCNHLRFLQMLSIAYRETPRESLSRLDELERLRINYNQLIKSVENQGEEGSLRFGGVNLPSLVTDCIRAIETGKTHSLFALQRGILLPMPKELGSYSYALSLTLKKEFDDYITDRTFSERGYVNAIKSRAKIEGNISGTAKIKRVLMEKEPERMIFYLRKDFKNVATRILIPKSDFYGGLTEEEACEKYGTETMERMIKHLGEITVSRDSDGITRIPYSDLNYAFKKAIGKRTSPEEWD